MIVFADAFFFIALLNRRDEYHGVVMEYALAFQSTMVTTQWILTEVADALAASSSRQAIRSLVDELADNPSVVLIDATPALFQRGLALYHDRPDKQWSLTDCISFVVMVDHGLSVALTGDRHFAQAGFQPVFG
jgi:predicted nucleic acid-binding protein